MTGHSATCCRCGAKVRFGLSDEERSKRVLYGARLPDGWSWRHAPGDAPNETRPHCAACS